MRLHHRTSEYLFSSFATSYFERLEVLEGSRLVFRICRRSMTWLSKPPNRRVGMRGAAPAFEAFMVCGGMPVIGATEGLLMLFPV